MSDQLPTHQPNVPVPNDAQHLVGADATQRLTALTLPSAGLRSIPLPSGFDELLETARTENQVTSPLPKYFNPLLRNQGAVNRNTLAAISQVGHSLTQLAGELESRDRLLERLVEHFNASLEQADQRQNSVAAWGGSIVEHLNALSRGARESQERINQVAEETTAGIRSLVRAIQIDEKTIAGLQQDSAAVQGRVSELEQARHALVRAIQIDEATLGAVQQSVAGLLNSHAALKRDLGIRLEALSALSRAIDQRIESVEKHAVRPERLDAAILQLRQAFQQDLASERTESSARQTENAEEFKKLAISLGRQAEEIARANEALTGLQDQFRNTGSALTELIGQRASDLQQWNEKLTALRTELTGLQAADLGQMVANATALRTEVFAKITALEEEARTSAKALTNQADQRATELRDWNARVDAVQLDAVGQRARSEQAQAELASRLQALDQKLAACLEATAAQPDHAKLAAEVAGTLEAKISALAQECGGLRSFSKAADAGLLACLEKVRGLQDNQAGLGRRIDDVQETQRTIQQQLRSLWRAGEQRKAPVDAGGGPHAATTPNEPAKVVSSATQRQLDDFYQAFELRFRGSRELVRERMRPYLVRIRKALAAASPRPAGATDGRVQVLDLGCGRGEWLGLLAGEGITARGIDLNTAFIGENRDAGHDVVEADALAYLRGLPDESVGAITAFHLVEHLPFAQLMELFVEAHRILKPRGLLLFETPNPQNVLVSTLTFHLDPTHRHPLPPALLDFMAQYVGFTSHEILPCHPYPADAQMSGTSEETRRWNQHFYGPQDYAILAAK